MPGEAGVNATLAATEIDALRDAMIGELRKMGAIRSGRVAEVFRAVARHLFAPGEPLVHAYAAGGTLLGKRGADGVTVSTVSAPHIQAMMLEQAEIGPGMRVLEIGSGGYNAALVAELVGETGEVTTVDIDPEVIDRARDCLAVAGYPGVNVVVADAEGGVPDHAPYDRIIVTAGAWDIPPAWVDQLADGGRLVVPLRLRGLTRSIVFERADGHLASRGYELCGFVPMQGAGECRERRLLLHDEKGKEVALRLDDGQQVNRDWLRRALSQPRVESWTGVTIGGMEPFDNLDLWLASALPDYGVITATSAARAGGIVGTVSRLGSSTLINEGSFAYRTMRSLNAERSVFEFGVTGHGPDARKVTDHLVEQIKAWDRDHRRNRACFEVYPADIPNDRLPAGRVINKRHTRVVILWPGQGH